MPLMRDEPPSPPVGWQALLRAAAGAGAIYVLATLPFAPDSTAPAAILFAAALCLGFTSNRTRQLTALMVSATAILRILAATWD